MGRLPHHWIWIVLGVSFFTLTSATSAAEAPPALDRAVVRVGDSQAVIIAKIGVPKSSATNGARTFLMYPEGRIILEKGVAVEVPGGLLVGTTAPPPSPAKAAPASAPAEEKPLAWVQPADPPASPAKAAANPPSSAVHDPEVHIIERKDEDGVTLIAQSEFLTDFTITLKADTKNLNSSIELPLLMDSAGRQAFELVRLKRVDPKQAWTYTTSFKFRAGGRRATTSNDAVYLLPYKTDAMHRVSQGNLGKLSHGPGSQNENAVDFQAEPGTVICAAREGIVTGVRQDYTEGGQDPKLKSQGNFVIVKHADGTYAEYYHLKVNGALVKLGQQVGAGQPIALSGNTGFTTEPHIHFAVFQTLDGEKRVTLPVKFKTRSGDVESLKEGVSY